MARKLIAGTGAKVPAEDIRRVSDALALMMREHGYGTYTVLVQPESAQVIRKESRRQQVRLTRGEAEQSRPAID